MHRVVALACDCCICGCDDPHKHVSPKGTPYALTASGSSDPDAAVHSVGSAWASPEASLTTRDDDNIDNSHNHDSNNSNSNNNGNIKGAPTDHHAITTNVDNSNSS